MENRWSDAMGQGGKLRVVILTGMDSTAIRSAISKLANLPEVQILAILFDSEAQTVRRRLRNLRRNVRREGLSYIPYRLAVFLRDFLDRLAACVFSQQEVKELLRRSFPDQAFCLTDLSQQHNIPIVEVGNLNGPIAVDTLRHLNADLGVVWGTRILKRTTFSIPRFGCLNVHMGKVPEYRGLPPGFWELYEKQTSAGVTIHCVDDGLDTGEIVGEDSVRIHPRESLETLQTKLGICATELLVRCVVELAQGRARRRPQANTPHKPRTAPTRFQRRELDEKLGQLTTKQSLLVYILKTLFNLSVYYSGLFHLVRFIRKIIGTSRACVLLYHRVNDLADDALTTGVERFAQHMTVIRKHYSVISTSMLIRKLQLREKLPSHSIVLHFDDCYRDIYSNASPILAQANFTACCFVSTGFIGTERVFPHDLSICPFQMANLMPEDIKGLIEKGLEVGSHSVNHADLGRCSYEEAVTEVCQSKKDLEVLLGKPVSWFSYPFGEMINIRAEIIDLVRKAGYEAMFSAYGGYVSSSSDLFDLQRVGASGQFRPVDLLMQIEGLSLGSFIRWR